MKFKIKYADKIVGVFILIAVVSVTGLIYLMGSNQRWFAKNYYFNTIFDSGGGLKPGMAINLSGFKIGQVNKLRLTEKNQTEVIFYIYDTYYEKIKKNSIIRYITSPIGLGSELVFYPGNDEGEPLPENSFIPSYNSNEAREMIAAEAVIIPPSSDTITNLINQVEPMLFNINRLILSLNNTMKFVNKSVKGQDTEDIGKIITNINVIAEEAENLLAKVNNGNLVQRFLADEGNLYGEVTDILTQVNSLMGEVDAILGQVESFTAYLNNVSPQITNLMAEGTNTLNESQKLMEGISNISFIKKGITEKDQADTFANIRDEDF